MIDKLKERIQKKYYDLPEQFVDDFVRVKPFTMVRITRSYALWNAVNYISAAGIEGAFVECGVWRGGQSMLAALAFSRNNRQPDFHLYDTYSGMSAPTDLDVRASTGSAARAVWEERQTATHNEWSFAALDDVKNNMSSVNYPAERVNYHVGMVEDTLKGEVPEKIAICRLDTDWYESTKMEMEVLFPRISPGGILIVDDYGSWAGSRKAVDEYLTNNRINILLMRPDAGGRIAVIPKA